MQNDVVDREQWLKARAELLSREKEHTQARQALAKARQNLPWVRLDKEYRFEGSEGDLNLSDLFKERSQLVVYHLMFGPGWEVPCPGCTSWANAFNCTTYQFRAADARLIAVSRAPHEEITKQRDELGWSFTWVSSSPGDFGIDFYGSSEDRSDSSSKHIGGKDGERVEFDRGENHGVSVFYRNQAGEIFHTYSCYNRGIEDLNGAFGYFDLLPKGRAW